MTIHLPDLNSKRYKLNQELAKSNLLVKAERMLEAEQSVGSIVGFALEFGRDISEPPLDPEEVAEMILNLTEEHEKKRRLLLAEDSTAITKAEELTLLLERRSSVSMLEARQKLNISASRLSNLLKEHQDLFRTIRQGQREKYITKRKGAGLIEDDGSVLRKEAFEPGCILPDGFHEFIAPETQSLKKSTFLAVCGLGDAGKTQFLINCAMANAETGRKVFFVQHEDDRETFWSAVARRILGRRPTSPEEVQGALESWGYRENLRLFIADGIVDLHEFLEELRERKPDVICYDYMSQEYMDLEIPEQRSVIARITNIIAEEVVAKGIPFLTAVQLEKNGKGQPDCNQKWLRRTNLCLFAKQADLKRSTSDQLCIPIYVKKNKQGGFAQGRKLVMYVGKQSYAVRKVLEDYEEENDK